MARSFTAALIAAAVSFVAFIVVLVAIHRSGSDAQTTQTILLIGCGAAVFVSVVVSGSLAVSHAVRHHAQWKSAALAIQTIVAPSPQPWREIRSDGEKVNGVTLSSQTVTDGTAPSSRDPIAHRAGATSVMELAATFQEQIPLQSRTAAPSDEATPVTSFEERRLVLRLILLVPVYALLVFASLAAPRAGALFDEMRQWYEGLTAFFFFQLMLSFFVDDCVLEKENTIGQQLVAEEAATAAARPLHTISEEDVSEVRESVGLRHVARLWTIMRDEVRTSKRPAFRFAAWIGRSAKFPYFVHLTLSIYVAWCSFLIAVSALVVAWNCYDEGALTLASAYFWMHGSRIMFIIPAIFPLLFCLFIVSRRMYHRSPIFKFITIKVIVFLNFWQAITISLIGRVCQPLGNSRLPEGMNPDGTLNLVLLCFELVPLAFVCRAVFPVTEDNLRIVPTKTTQVVVDMQPTARQSLGYLLTIRDVIESMKWAWRERVPA